MMHGFEFPTYTRHEYAEIIDGDGVPTMTYRCALCGIVVKRLPHEAGTCLGVPVYETWGDVPEGLATKTQIRDAGKKLAKDQSPIGAKKKINRNGKWKGGYYPLYAIADAVERPAPTEAQLKALEKARYYAESVDVGCIRCHRWIGSYVRRKVEDENLHQQLCHVCQDRDDIIEKMRGVMGSEFVILDTETTGLYGADAIEIAIINHRGETLFNSRIQTEKTIDTGAYEVHGISKGDLAGAPTFEQVFEQIASIIDGAHVWIYNADFDMDILDRMAERIGKRFEPKKVSCAMRAYAKWFGDWSDYHGSYRWQRLAGGDHTALGDCLATLETMRAVANNGKVGQ